MKKLAALLLALCLAISATACSNADAPSSQASSSPAAPSSSSEPAQESTSGKEPATIRIYTHWGESYKHDGLEKLFDALEQQQSDYVYEATHLSGDTLVERVMMEITSGEAPDIISGRASDRTEFIDAGYMYEMDDAPWVKDWDENLLKCDTYNGHLYGLPYDVEVGGIWYNMNVLDQYGLKVPTTKSEFIAMCDTLVKNGVTPIAFGAAESDPCQYTMSYFVNAILYNNGTFDANKALLENTGSVKDIPAYQEALTNAYEMFIPYLNENDLGITRETAYEQFLAGERAMTIQGNFVVGVFREADPNCNVAFGPIPQSDNAKENLVGTTSDNDLMVLKGGNTDGAMAFINFMASDEGRDIWAKTTGNLSASSAEVASGVDPMNLSAYEWVKNGQIYMRGDLVTLSGNVNSEWQSLTQKFIVEGYAANKSGTSADAYVAQFLDDADVRFSAL